MGIFAKIGGTGKVKNVIKADYAFIKYLPGNWVDVTRDNAKRKHDVAIGDIYDPVLDQFYRPQPFKGWILNENFIWVPPVSKPAETATEKFEWDNKTETWQKYSVTTKAGKIVVKKI
jgi:hypothetical protein